MAGDDFLLPEGFLVGAATSAHQTEGGNLASDWWAFEQREGAPVAEPSGDAVDSYHRWPQDMDLLRDLGLNAYRFGIEWARVEPVRGRVSRAALDHYARMIDGALERGLEPVVTLHHFTSPAWFTEAGGWTAPGAAEAFADHVRTVAPLLADRVRYACTINEPNMLAVMHTLLDRGLDAAPAHGHIEPDERVAAGLTAAHRAAREALRAELPGLRTGWTVANQAYQALPGAEQTAAAYARPREDAFLEAAAGDDWIGVQAYTRTRIGPDGPLPVPEGAETTLTGWEYHPRALGEAIRHTAEATGGGVPILVTENGIATGDDGRRAAYIREALHSMAEAMRDGIDVRGYLHWSALDNYEWGSYRPTFGLIAVDRATFTRTPRPSARLLGEIARTRRIPAAGSEEPAPTP
ncbi:glycoside hydrolase family 1 protein [Nocardiopsis composta]|uniref:Beta-glucosidase n=1 Tax=Nocardiopsis composta TaxID=157465 RepID=A0A7W8QJH0_9ACTN|nr:family 1 glycosylhydrolase [Nocardiopsis composta]MBB5430875.1 beta-glucosidase [Nocardiopsis composta]